MVMGWAWRKASVIAVGGNDAGRDAAMAYFEAAAGVQRQQQRWHTTKPMEIKYLQEQRAGAAAPAGCSAGA